MRTWLKIALLSALTIGISIYASHTIATDCRSVCQPLQQMEQALIAEDWAAAGQLFAEAQQRWRHPERIWPLLIDHDDSHDIEISFVDLETALQLQDNAKAQQELASLLYHINHVLKHERITWQNVL